MSATSVIERVKTSLVALKMPRALEVLDVTLRGIERGEIGAVEAIDALLTEELTTRENRRVRMAVQMARLSAIKTLAGFDFAFQPSLDRNRILALAGEPDRIQASDQPGRLRRANAETVRERNLPAAVNSSHAPLARFSCSLAHWIKRGPFAQSAARRDASCRMWGARSVASSTWQPTMSPDRSRVRKRAETVPARYYYRRFAAMSGDFLSNG
jgi:IstB-like ATP binding protein